MIALKGKKDRITVNTEARVQQGENKVLTVKFKVVWRKPQYSVARDIVQQLTDEDANDSSWVEVFKDWITDVQQLRDADNELVVIEDETELHNLIEAMMDEREYRAALVTSFLEAFTGQKATLAKN